MECSPYENGYCYYDCKRKICGFSGEPCIYEEEEE